MKRNSFPPIPLFIILFNLISITAFTQSRDCEIINNNWKFTLDTIEVKDPAQQQISWKEINLPHTWNNLDIQSGEKVHYGSAWYTRELTLEKNETEAQYFLKFNGVGQYACLYINNKYAGEHLGSYSAFCFNITPFLRFDTINNILLEVNNELNDSYPKDNFLFGIFGGIYRDVELIKTSDIHFALSDYGSSGIYVSQEDVCEESAILNIESLVKNETSVNQDVTIKNTLYNIDNESVVQSEDVTLIHPGGAYPVTSLLKVNTPWLWNGKIDPYLYTLKTEIFQDGVLKDEIRQTIGIRYYSIDSEKGFILNGEPYRLYGVCRHQEWENLGNALLPEHHRKDMELIYEMGATSVRLAHYQQADYIYSLADSLGILIWAEIPFVNGYRENADGNALQQMNELIKQNYNHPSIFVWGLHNEVIKGKTIQQPVNLTVKLHNLAKSLDRERFTVSVSNIWWVHDHPIHELADLQGFNQYTGWYGGRPSGLIKWIRNYHSKKPDVRFSVSEYGAGGNTEHQSLNDSTTPNPTGQYFPEGYQTYYHEITWSAIEESPFIWASYVWNMFDFSVPEWNRGGIKGRNHKGLINYDRKTKKDAFYWYKANWSDEKVLHLAGKRNNTQNTSVVNIKAYCNFAVPELFINGESYGKMDKGLNEVHYTSKEVLLPPGEHQVEVKANFNEMLYRDAFQLVIEE